VGMNLFKNGTYLRIIKREFEEVDIIKVRKVDHIRKYFDMSKKGEYTLDDQTWEDLDMNKVYAKLDRNYSSLGESVLYSMLRNPSMNEDILKERDTLIELFKDNEKLREQLLYIFFGLNKDRKNHFLEMIENDLIINKLKYYIYTFLGKIVPAVIILIGILIDKKYLLSLFATSGINMLINSNERNSIKSNGIFYLRSIIKAAKKISNIKSKEIVHYTDRISDLLKSIKILDRGTRLVSMSNMWGGFFETFSVLFLIEESAYYSISSALKEKKQELMELYYTMGELEALLSVAGYQYNLQEDYVSPKFVQELTLRVTNGIHPLIEGAVPNSINIENKGIVLTGTNMSGKSTFLRTLGVNILLSQTFYFALAEKYEACFFNIVSSISPNDDLVKGKSFYMAEAEAILRIIKALEKEIPVFCPIDEIFRGTNPVERISMSAEILTYLSRGNSISLVATHDRELVDILKDIYEFYYFSEVVDNKNGLSFDYKLKKGITQSRNAIKLLDYIGYPKEIVEKSYKRAESIKGFI
jgi:DNA mismatch repair ATPase MutS